MGEFPPAVPMATMVFPRQWSTGAKAQGHPSRPRGRWRCPGAPRQYPKPSPARANRGGATGAPLFSRSVDCGDRALSGVLTAPPSCCRLDCREPAATTRTDRAAPAAIDATGLASRDTASAPAAAPAPPRAWPEADGFRWDGHAALNSRGRALVCPVEAGTPHRRAATCANRWAFGAPLPRRPEIWTVARLPHPPRIRQAERPRRWRIHSPTRRGGKSSHWGAMACFPFPHRGGGR